MRGDEYCTCAETELEPPHSCPFAEEINDNFEENCTCCPECTYECAMDI